MEINDDERWKSYFYDGENVLKNKLNIHNEQELKLEEYKIVTKKNALLYLSNIEGNFDVEHLKSIHKYLFDSIYPFAGEFRTVNIAKGNKSSFADYNYIDLYFR